MQRKWGRSRATFTRLVCVMICLVSWVILQAKEVEPKTVEVVFTHDLHSHLEGFITEEGGKIEEVGGFARIKTYIDEKKKENPGELLIVDAGDFSMGTIYQTLYETKAPELRLLGALGYDVTTFGNHEFDYGTTGLSNMLDRAKSSGETLPQLAICNIDWPVSLKTVKKSENKILKQRFDEYGVKPYAIIEKNGVKIAVIGVFGQSALTFSPMNTLTFSDPIKAVKQCVLEIKKENKADLIVCISHSGTNDNKHVSEDEKLAEKVPDIDLIISGHSHTKLDHPIIQGETTIASCGEYGKYVGDLKLTQKENGRWQVGDYALNPMNGQIKQDKKVNDRVQDLSNQVNETYLKPYHYTKDQVLCYNPWVYPSVKEMGDEIKEQPFANLIADAYTYSIDKQKIGAKEVLSVVPMGVIRDTFPAKQMITVSQIYSAFSLGKGKDGTSGYPLICIYLTGKELRVATEIDASLASKMPEAQLYISGLSYKINPSRWLLNKVANVELMDFAGNKKAIKDETLYPVVTDLYSAQMLGKVTKLSYGLLAIKPKDKEGVPLNNFEDAIIYDENGEELKAWVAIARYLQSFGRQDQVGEIPGYYKEAQGRKVIKNDSSMAAIIETPGVIVLRLISILLASLMIFVIVINYLIKTLRKPVSVKH